MEKKLQDIYDKNINNNFMLDKDGVIKSIAVEKGNAVDKGQLLVEFE